MADETETGGTGPRIENEEQFKKWLEETRPAPDVCVALAVPAYPLDADGGQFL